MKARLLHIDVNATFINPTRNLLPVALTQGCETRFFGPGYVTTEVLARGLAAFIAAEGPFDVISSNSLVLFAEKPTLSAYIKAIRKAYAFSCDENDLAYLAIIAADFIAQPIPRLVILLENDFYNWTGRDIERISQAGDFFIGFGEEFCPFLKDMPFLSRERFAASATDHWAEFCRSQRHRVGSLLHFVADTELDVTPVSVRPEAWSVMGVQYHSRQVARDTLIANGIQPVIDTRLRKFVSLLKKLRLLGREKRFIQTLLNGDFARRLRACRYSYTCGSALDMPIRKFFEIPASGALLVCRPFHGFGAAGFADGVNCVVSEPDALGAVHQRVSEARHTYDAVAAAGQQLMIEQHSIAARARHFAVIIEAIAERRFFGSFWDAGEHRLRPMQVRSLVDGRGGVA